MIPPASELHAAPPPRSAPRTFALLALLISLAGCSAASSKRTQTSPTASPTASSKGAPGATLPRFDTNLALLTFDKAWSIIHETHFDTNFNGVNWLALRDELRPQAARAGSNQELRSLIEGMLDRLGHSHMALIPSEAADRIEPSRQPRPAPTQTSTSTTTKPGANPNPQRRIRASNKPSSTTTSTHPAPVASSLNPTTTAGTSQDPNLEPDNDDSREGDLGIEVRLLDGRPHVFRVDPDSPAAHAGVKPGWILQRIGQNSIGTPLPESTENPDTKRLRFYAWARIAGLLTGTPERSVELEFLDERDVARILRLAYRQNRGEPAKLGNLPTFYARLDSRRIGGPNGDNIGFIHFNVWMFPIAAGFDRAIDEFRGARGIVIDMRGNLGGVGGMIMGVAGHFLDQPLPLGTFKTRQGELTLRANPRRVSAAGQRVEPFAGPVAILTDAISLSAAEVFAGGMQDLKRARIFGETSGGQALPAIFDRLPNGDILYHAFADFTTPSGTRLEFRGVIPDHPVPLTRAHLLAGRDPVLETAVDWIRSQPAARR